MLFTDLENVACLISGVDNNDEERGQADARGFNQYHEAKSFSHSPEHVILFKKENYVEGT